ncbi:MAG: DEAD/DEAH box helicase, partial [Betaproteobacteria bacterium]|nr:DEAD/DEAH box helicase [Betaproteobacteria bacterium]
MPTAAAVTTTAAAGFAALGLTPELLRAVAEQGYTDPTPIQVKAIPPILAGRDLLGAAQTGTGKTAGFTLPMLQRLSAGPADRNPRRQGSGANGAHAPRLPRALVLVPTRELAAQVQDSIRTYGKHLRLTSTTIYGGVGFQPQVQALRRGIDIVVATPGRLLDHVQQRTLDLRNIGILVLDEADRMLDMGFIHDIRKIHALLPRERHTLLFSATFSDEIRTLSGQFLRDPVTVEVARRNAPIELVTQVAHFVDKHRKRELLARLVKDNDWRQVLVFCKTKHGADRLAGQLGRDGIDADAIHGNKSQPQRMRALKRFKDAELQVLVATDIAARGIDIDALPHVVNYDLPNVSEDYVHRIGRTGRAGATGDAISLVCAEDRSLLMSIERLINKRIDQVVIPGFEPTQSFARAPANKPARRNTGGGGRSGGDGGYGDRRPSGNA